MTTGITLWQHLCNRAEAMRLEALQDVKNRADWERIRPRRYREYIQSMGLDPLPARGDLGCVDRMPWVVALTDPIMPFCGIILPLTLSTQ